MLSIETKLEIMRLCLRPKPLSFVIEPRNSGLNLRAMWQGIDRMSGAVGLLFGFPRTRREGEGDQASNV